MRFFVMAVFLVAGNFLYAYLTSAPYGVAIERSFFQMIAMLLTIIVAYFPESE
jgi:hypothetical protein